MAAGFSPTMGSIASAYPIVLNDRWRIVEDECQWVLQYRRGNPSLKSTGWHSRCFIRRRDWLLERIIALCGPLNASALVTISGLPEVHP
nr:hypothetical protein RKHAN_03337 [Rhizobium sp. Khangiran2]